MKPAVHFRDLGETRYEDCWEAMRQFTRERTEQTVDEVWWTEHPAVFTEGVNSREAHQRNVGEIPVIRSDRGGQITYHGPGQLLCYTLIDLQRRHISVRQWVIQLEQMILNLLDAHGVVGHTRRDAPGVYVAEAKLASIGLRVKQGACYHGLSLNVHMDLAPFQRIDPCGYAGMSMTDLHTLGVSIDLDEAKQCLSGYLTQELQAL